MIINNYKNHIKMKKLILLMVAGSFLSSCAVTSSMKTSQRKLSRQAEANANSAKVVNKPILADLEVALKRETTIFKTTNKDIAGTMLLNTGGSSSQKGNILATASEGMKNEAKNRAQFQFMGDHKCDYLVDPIYKIETESTSETNIVNITVEVSAFPASYKRFSQPDSLPKSVFQMDQVDGREIALSTYASDLNKTDKQKNKGFIFGFGLSKWAESEFGKIEDSKSAFAFTGGYFLNVPLSSKLGLRSEYNTTIKNSKTESVSEGINYTVTSSFKSTNLALQLPLMLQLNPSSNFGLYIGPAINYTLLWTYKQEDSYDYVFSADDVEKSEGDVKDFKALQAGLILGAGYQSSGSFGLGLRYETGLGVDKWNVTSLTMSFRLK